MKAMALLVLVRHGQSIWNAANLFTGWTDVELSEKGFVEAKDAGEILSDMHLDLVFTSDLIRAQKTAEIILEGNLKSENVQKITDFRLNERHYGDLQGMNKDDARKEFGKEQVHIWRRSYDVHPPGGESLRNVVERVKPYFENTIKKDLEDEKNILLSAHGNSLRALFLILNFYTTETISTAEIPTGKPFIIEYENNKITNKYFL